MKYVHRRRTRELIVTIPPGSGWAETETERNGEPGKGGADPETSTEGSNPAISSQKARAS